MSILTGLVIVVAMATLAQKSDRLFDIVFGEDVAEIAPQNDSVTVVAGRPEIIDVLVNDENVLPEDRGGVRILVSPSCGAAETADNGVLYISNDLCIGEQLFAYCVQRGDDCPSASVTVNVVSSEAPIPAAETLQIVAAAPAPATPSPAAPAVAAPSGGQVTVQATAPAAESPQIGAAPVPSRTETEEPLTIAATAPTTNGGVAAAVQPFDASTPGIAQLGRSPTFGADSDTNGALQSLRTDSEPVIRLGAAPVLPTPLVGDGAAHAQGDGVGQRVARLTLESGADILSRPEAPDLSDIARPAPTAVEPTVTARVEPTPTAPETAKQIQSDAIASVSRDDDAVVPAPIPRPAVPGTTEAPIARGCGVAEINSRRGPGANSNVKVRSSCRAGEIVLLSHAGLEFAGQLDNTGLLEMELPVMDIDSGVVAIFADGGRTVTPLDYDERAVELALRVAVAWTTPVDLDLHVFEYAARFGGDGHVWQQNPRAFREVRRAGGGYLSSFPALTPGGQSIEVYTFWANSRARPGFARIALDHASRGDTPSGDFCGSGPLATPDYQVVRSANGSVTSRSIGRFSAAACGVALAVEARYANGAVKDLEIVGR